ncbi:helix-hairpin-helix domain-containing protein [Paraliobacillus salinarum]|uniref:helix-hairpin-helix domain-containing protein n=1 Tax=Paraliobacillus salinarum TaxID=1158996 RepID=UPI0015F51C84|nr:helix-hairpin-helix domain-containing protein [Paraliobacillus salinarum]
MKNWIKHNWLLSCIVLLVLSVGMWEWFGPDKSSESNNDLQLEDTSVNEPTDTNQETSNIIIVDVKGEVENPDIYQVSEDERVKDVILLAGGFSEEADSSSVNLAQKVFDEMVITVPRKNNNSNQSSTSSSTISSTESTSSLVKINQATKEEIETLPGIGAVKAEAIVQYREEHGFFQSVSDLESITGIGQKTVEKLEPHIQIP